MVPGSKCHGIGLEGFIYLSLETGEGREKERRGTLTCERSTNWLPLAGPIQGPGLQPRHVPQWGIKLASFQSAGQCPTHGATPVRATE